MVSKGSPWCGERRNRVGKEGGANVSKQEALRRELKGVRAENSTLERKLKSARAENEVLRKELGERDEGFEEGPLEPGEAPLPTRRRLP